MNSLSLSDDQQSEFRREIQSLISRHTRENASNSRDFILAEYLMNCLVLFDSAVAERRRGPDGDGARGGGGTPLARDSA